MPRLSVCTRAAVVSLTVFSVLVVGWATAGAQTSSPRAVLDRATHRVGFRDTGVVRGHVQGGVVGHRVSLQRRVRGAEWRTIATKPLDDRGRVRFRPSDLRMTAAYRLVYADEATATSSTSNTARIRVRPALTFNVGRRNVMPGASVGLKGHLYPLAPGRRARIERRVNGRWQLVRRVAVGDGSFRTGVSAGRSSGYNRVRIRFMGDAYNLKSLRRGAFRVHRWALATWYGPGLYGNGTACGQTLTPYTMGVAHRTLPCGTKVHILYRGRAVTVPVIDRGPYSGAEWDLTSATARRVGFSGSGYIGVLH